MTNLRKIVNAKFCYIKKQYTKLKSKDKNTNVKKRNEKSDN